MNQENAGKMMKVLKEFGFDTPELSLELFLQKDRMIRLGMPPMQIEVLVEISLKVNRPMAILRITTGGDHMLTKIPKGYHIKETN